MFDILKKLKTVGTIEEQIAALLVANKHQMGDHATEVIKNAQKTADSFIKSADMNCNKLRKLCQSFKLLIK